MKLLVARQEMLDQLFADARKQLVEVAKDAARYEKFLADGLVQVSR
jgi:V-type H+-transporting ATPase subunit E